MSEHYNPWLTFEEFLTLADCHDPENLTTELVLRHADPEERARPKGTVSWDDLLNCSTKLLDYKQQSTNVIFGFLSYYPDDRVLIDHEFYLRSLLASQDSNSISMDDSIDDVLEIIQKIRNHDIRLRNWDKEYNLEGSCYHSYKNDDIYFADKARAMLVEVVGFEPELAHSLRSELAIRRFLSDDRMGQFELNQALNSGGWVTVYRRALFEHGRSVANALPVMNLINLRK